MSYLLGLAEIRQLARMAAIAPNLRRFALCAPESRDFHVSRHTRAALSQATFLNRQALYLRPDPARVIVRPFKPATEPRDLNPTDKTRANHIVDRVLALDAAGGRQPTGRSPREFSGAPSQSARDVRGARRRDGRRLRRACEFHAGRSANWSAPISCTNILSKRRRCSIRASSPIPINPARREGGRRFILSLRAVGEGHVSSLTFRSGSIAADGGVSGRSDGASGVDSESDRADLRPDGR